MRKCKICGKQPATWIMQYIASDEPSFTLPGSHYRGFATTPVCDACKEKIKKEATMTASIRITARRECKMCHGTGTVTDYVDYGSTVAGMDSDCDACVEAGWPDDANDQQSDGDQEEAA